MIVKSYDLRDIPDKVFHLFICYINSLPYSLGDSEEDWIDYWYTWYNGYTQGKGGTKWNLKISRKASLS